MISDAMFQGLHGFGCDGFSLQVCGHEMNSFVNSLGRCWFAPMGAGDIEISTVFGCFHLHSGVRLFLELTKPMFEVTSGICGNFTMRMPKFRFHEEKFVVA